MADATIRHRLDLLLRLIDTTSGAPVFNRDVGILLGGKPFLPIYKDGCYLFLSIGRETVELTVSAAGFEPRRRIVRWEELDEMLPAMELHLIPNRSYRSEEPLFTLEGSLPGIADLTAVKAGDVPCMIREFDERKRILTIFNPHLLQMADTHYAVVNPDEGSYEPFAVTKRLSDSRFELAAPLQKPFSNHFPITRLIFGSAREDGDYLLRVRNSGAGSVWIARYLWDGVERFAAVDFARGSPAAIPIPERSG